METDFVEKYVDVIVSKTNKEVDKIFTYLIPDLLKDEICLGMRVLVPFAQGNKTIEGYVIGFRETIDFDEQKLKTIKSLPDKTPIFSEHMIKLAYWMKDKYYTTFSSVLQCIMPSGLNIVTEYIISVVKKIHVSEKADKIVDYILNNKNSVTLEELKEEFGNISSSMSTLDKKGLITKTELSKVKDYVIRVKYAYLNTTDDNENIIEQLIEEGNIQGKILTIIRENREVSVSDIKKILKITDTPILNLQKNNLITIEKIEIRRNIFISDGEVYKKDLILNQEQQNVLDFLKNELYSICKKPVLLHGVTGSGKTEVYLKIIDEVLNQNKQAIVLVPEISLTPQTVSRFIGRFGDRVSVTHSRLSIAERFDQWKKARDNQIDIMIGPRSAIFTPFNNIGVIIIDEEHESTYVSETTPKYNTIEVAKKLSELTNSLLILGSATPSINSYHNTETYAYHLQEINKRVNDTLPDIFVVDMRQELLKGNKSIFSEDLKLALQDTISKGQQAILFLNRRGHSTFVSCRACGLTLECTNCNISYTYHVSSKKMICHYCGKESKVPTICPSCGSKYIKYFGVGTQKIEEEIKKMFPEEKILRMDIDTVSKKHSHEKILTEFRKGDSKILIGTQMIAKGLDFPNVTLVGIIAADLSLNNGDYRSAETTFQLLSQVSGRSGRDKIKGNVFIQTYNPLHYSITFAKQNDYIGFYKEEIMLRRFMNYPPFSSIFNIIFSSLSEKDVINNINNLAELMAYYNKNNQFDVLGPAPCTISKIRNKYRWKLIIKATDEEKLKNYVFFCIDILKKNTRTDNVNINATLNPVVVL